jgi:hypothetical protein
VIAVGISLGEQSLSACPEADGNNSETVTVDELVQMVGLSLNGCPA